ncbi:ZIP family metal transporter [Candidatus Woesearchaeota archaeon]|nr:ZIP family metal transporter [Candidatus Woesearchaeota archaeon]
MAFSTLATILLAVFTVSIVSFIGAFLLFFNVKRIEKLMFPLVSFAAGALLAAAFFDLIPEAVAADGGLPIFSFVLGGIVLFFVVEKLMYWYHCHNGRCETHHAEGHGHHGHPKQVKPVAWLNLFGDGVHNFLDGVIIAATFVVNPGLGVVTTLAVILHEIPQEIGDFSVLIYSGLSRTRALFYNFLTALTAVLGALVAFFYAEAVESAEPALLAFAAGGFIYIAAADLIPELHHDQEFPKSLIQLAWFGVGVMAIYLVSRYFAA